MQHHVQNIIPIQPKQRSGIARNLFSLSLKQERSRVKAPMQTNVIAMLVYIDGRRATASFYLANRYRQHQETMQATPESDRADEGPSTSATLTRAERLRLAVEHCRRTDAPTAPVARQYGLAPTTLYRHVRGGVGSPGWQPSFGPSRDLRSPS